MTVQSSADDTDDFCISVVRWQLIDHRTASPVWYERLERQKTQYDTTQTELKTVIGKPEGVGKFEA